MGRILVHDFRHFSHGSSLGRTRPNRRADISPLRWALQMKKISQKHTQQLAVLVYVQAMKKQIEAKYLKRIEYLVNANNELMYELEQRELELVTIESELVTVEKEC